jgi:hypothetical protein
MSARTRNLFVPSTVRFQEIVSLLTVYRFARSVNFYYVQHRHESVCSPHVIMVFIMFFMAGTSLYGLALLLPSIVDQLGFSAKKSQLLSVGPFVVDVRVIFLWRKLLRLMHCLLLQ